MMPGIMYGRVTLKKVCQALAPRSREASSSDSSKPDMRERTTTATNGKLKAMWLMAMVNESERDVHRAEVARMAMAMQISGITIGR